MKAKVFLGLILLIFVSFFFIPLQKGVLAQGRVLESLEKSISSLVEKTKPSLVTIQGKKKDLLTEFFYLKAARKKDNTVYATFVGSGLVYRPDGYILTTTSVAGGLDLFKVTLADGKEVKGNLVGTDDQYNLAVIKIGDKGLIPASMGNSEEVKVGSWVTVVGNSYGVPNAVSFGVVNGIRKDGLIQMSANVSPGNSGGPVLNTKGEVVRIVSVKVSEPSYLEAVRMVQEGKKNTIVIPPRQIELPSGVSLAIPINEVKRIADDIIEHGTIQRGYLGVYPSKVDEKIQREYGVYQGVFIEEVIEGSPAEEAGMEDEDIVLEYDNKKIRDEKQFRELILDTKPGEEVEIKVLREGEKKNLMVKIGKAEPIYGVNYFPAPPAELFISEYELPETPEVLEIPEIEKMKVSTEEVKKEHKQILEQLKEFQAQMQVQSQYQKSFEQSLQQMKQLQKLAQEQKEEYQSYEISREELDSLKIELEKLREELKELKQLKDL